MIVKSYVSVTNALSPEIEIKAIVYLATISKMTGHSQTATTMHD
jgi:hypothetical protein